MKFMKFKICQLASIILVLLLTGCGGSFNVVTKNTTDKQLNDVKVIFGKTNLGGGIFIPKSQSTYMNASDSCSIPQQAIIYWATEDGKRHSQTVEVKKHLPKFFRCINIIIAINEDNTVSVSWEKD